MIMVDSDFELLNKKYNDLNIIKQDGEYIISGPVQLDHLYGSVRMTGMFELEIKISDDFPNTIPSVRELSEKIDRSYPHLYLNGNFCLASNIELKIYFSKNRNIGKFIDDYIIPYLYTYRYYEEYGVYPYGERSHGLMGDLEYLKELFQVNNWDKVFEIMIFISKSKYRGHLACPCQSGKKLRNCHGPIIKEIINLGLTDYIINILNNIAEGMNKKNGKYNSATKAV